jgi:hypothetical protein
MPKGVYDRSHLVFAAGTVSRSPVVSRQDYANAVVVGRQLKGGQTFDELLVAFRLAGYEYDRLKLIHRQEETFRRRQA